MASITRTPNRPASYARYGTEYSLSQSGTRFPELSREWPVPAREVENHPCRADNC
ncbi:hypothetical protein GCM10007079_10350 [Nocardiopsis terrae]|nr:hypothetical protein GCM10007079_10350 [Nocardiopsis terrae]